MRINIDKDIEDLKRAERKKGGVGKTSGDGFAAIFDSHLEKREKERLKRLMDEAERAGRELASDMNEEALKKYKKKVRAFLTELLAHYNSRKVESQTDRQGREKIYRIVDRINQDLDEISEEAVENMKSPMEIMAKIEEIRGLMVDTFA